MSINLKNKQELVKKFGKNEKDTGSSAVQVAMMTQKISELTEHLKSNKKDFATKRGLLMMATGLPPVAFVASFRICLRRRENRPQTPQAKND